MTIDERIARIEQRTEDHERRLEIIEERISDIYEKFQTYLPRWVTAMGVVMGMALGSCLTVITILISLQ